MIYSIEDLAEALKFNKAAVKAYLRQLKVDTDNPISEQDAKRLAHKMRKDWPLIEKQ